MDDNLLCNISDPDYNFNKALDEMDTKVFRKIKSFIKTLYDSNSILKISEDRRIININESRMYIAHDRMTKNQITEDSITIRGTLIGFSPVKRTFDLKDEKTNEIITGKVSPKLSQKYMDIFRVLMK